jgi:hypothetical protein
MTCLAEYIEGLIRDILEMNVGEMGHPRKEVGPSAESVSVRSTLND